MSEASPPRLQAEGIAAAASRVHALLAPTPLVRCEAASRRLGLELHLKLDNLQVTGSFKARGAVHKLACLDAKARARGVVAASSGNHGLALAWAGRRQEIPVEVFVPEVADASKVAQIEALGARVHRHGPDCTDAEARARAVAESTGRSYVSPYNDLQVVQGQGSLGVELFRQAQRPFDAVFIALGGGGLAAAVGTYLHAHWPEVEIVGVSPEASPALHVCLERGEIVEVPCGPTLSDGTAGGVEAGACTFPWAQRELGRRGLVDEAAIAAAMRRALLEAHQVIEGAAGVAWAGLEAMAADWRGARVCVVVCGGNVAADTLRTILGPA